ncbi:MAG: hypothetical protein HY588_02750 [Candidatus Omnitrophica bacterium]|nr:hypothetical protein [Candidatus Omnitrophota bacterium]
MVNLYLRKRKQFLKRTILTVSLLILAFFFYALFRFIAYRFFGYDLFASDISIVVLSVFVMSLLYKPVDYFVLLLFKEVLFRSYLRDHTALVQLTRSLTKVLNRNELANLIVNTFGEMLHVLVASILVREKSKGIYRVISAFGLNPSAWRNVEFSPNALIIELLRIRRVPLEREQAARPLPWQDANQLRHDFQELHASCVIPLIFQGELIGSINLTPRGAAKTFSPQDIKSFFEFAKEAAAAFHNAGLFDELEQSIRELMKIQSEFLHSAQHSAIAQLATGIAHEIHNPLTIISGKAQILLLKRDKIAYDDQVEDVLKTIVKQTKRAADITRKLLMFSESHKLVKELIDFEMLVNDTISLLSYQVSLDQIQVIRRFEQPLPKWLGNIGELREAFLNLFLNAVQAIGTKGIIEVEARYHERDRVAELRICDSGPGIAKEDLPRIFHPFFTTREGASGLGLFVTQQIIHGYKGSVRVENRPGHGAAFIIELPYRAEPLPRAFEAEGDSADPSAPGDAGLRDVQQSGDPGSFISIS